MTEPSPGLLVRPARSDDFTAVVALQRACFPRMIPWTRAEFSSQLDHFPDGQLVVEVDGRVAASAASLIVDEAEYREWHDWETVSDDGRIRNHDPDGDILYGIEIQVHPDFRGQKLSAESTARHHFGRMFVSQKPSHTESLMPTVSSQIARNLL